MNFATQSEIWLRGLERRRKPIKPATLATWGSVVRAHIIPRIGSANLSAFDNGAMKAFADGLCGNLRARTVRDIVLVAKMIVASVTDSNGNQVYARVWNDSWIDLPPVTPTSTPSTDSKTIEQLISHSPPKYGILYALLAGSGLRLGESLAIRIGDDDEHTCWDRDASVIHVRKSIFRGVEQFPKTNAAVRSVDLCEELNEALAESADRRRGRRGDFLFASRSGTPLAPATIYKHSLSKTSVRGAHSFRRFRVTHLSEKQVPVQIVKFWIGHAKADITEQYSRLSENLMLRREWARRVGLGFDLPQVREVVKT
jgi:integrase